MWLAERAGRELERRSNSSPRGMTVTAGSNACRTESGLSVRFAFSWSAGMAGLSRKLVRAVRLHHRPRQPSHVTPRTSPRAHHPVHTSQLPAFARFQLSPVNMVFVAGLSASAYTVLRTKHMCTTKVPLSVTELSPSFCLAIPLLHRFKF